ncbi:hypothetical protein ACGF0D_22370 [Kitasatospora sp. NPDC048298]|uniref:hypothetical protein n=1 Tax=Kitasatospora sp. NPDC048298 TaxID=3364049 RepID=UPI0037184A39
MYELYRNGIVHGSILNFDNIVVATKAWNRLFAVADWARAREKEQQPPPPKPSLRDLFSTLTQNQQVRKAVEAFQPYQLSPGNDGFASHPVHSGTVAFLKAWKQRNFGAMTDFATLELHQRQGKAAPREVRLVYDGHRLNTFKVQSISFTAAAVCTVQIEIEETDSHPRQVGLRWIREDTSGSPIPVPLDGGTWRLYTWDPARFVKFEEAGSPDST